MQWITSPTTASDTGDYEDYSRFGAPSGPSTGEVGIRISSRGHDEMNGDICYFSSTGNSLAIARELSDELSCRLVPITSTTDAAAVKRGSDMLGFVFPVYHASYGGTGVPNIVKEFVCRIGGLEDRYVFSVCTHSGTPVDTVGNFMRLVESLNGRLELGASVQMSVPTSPVQKLSHMITNRPLKPAGNQGDRQLALYRDWEIRKPSLVRDLERRATRIETPGPFSLAVSRRLSAAQQTAVLKRYRHLADSTSNDLEELFQHSDLSFEVSAHCNRCGICAQVCPVGNIEIDGGPRWQHRCELCYACYQWCPREAIKGDIVEFETRQHHPAVSLRDMTSRRLTG